MSLRQSAHFILCPVKIAANIAKLPELLTRPQYERHALMADWGTLLSELPMIRTIVTIGLLVAAVLYL